MKRRTFIETGIKAAATACVTPGILLGAGKEKVISKKAGKVVVASDRNLVTDTSQINKRAVRSALDDTLIALTGKNSIRDAWMEIFPNLNTSDTIGLKINGINPKLPTHPDVAYAIAQSLSESLSINPNNILIWDRSNQELVKAKYRLNSGKEGFRCFGTLRRLSKREPLFSSNFEDYVGYDKNALVDLGDDVSMHLSRIITEICTYLINVPVLKDHKYGAGVTLSLKNHYGSISEPQRCHGGGGDPYIGNLNNLSYIKDKTRLVVCDGLFASYDGGPYGAPQWISHRLMASFDPVAHDYIGAELIDRKRSEQGLDPVTPKIEWFKTAVKHGLGTNDPKAIETVLI